MILNKKAETGWKTYATVIAVILIAYGYYGFIYVPQHSTSFAKEKPICPLGYENAGTSSFKVQQTGGPCLYSFYSLILGVIVIIAVIAATLKGH